ncbi:MAG: hypothetical protein LUB61_06730, partial [Eggerthellaceae bacterium]|nr:hypothetical protein [Eggerthellaceae bacterium]
AWAHYMDSMRAAKDAKDIDLAHAEGMEIMRAIPVTKPANPMRIGIIGDMYTAIDEKSNLDLDLKLMHMGVEVHRDLNLTNRFIHYDEPNLRLSSPEYLTYDMGPTTTINVVAAHKFARQGFDGVIHAKAAACTPEIDSIPILQRISSDYEMPILYLTYDSQTSDAGLDTCLEAFYDMLAMKKEKIR